MTRIGLDGEKRGLRRLPKHPSKSPAAPSPGKYEADAPPPSQQKAAPQLYFEPLPMPWTEASEVEERAASKVEAQSEEPPVDNFNLEPPSRVQDNSPPPGEPTSRNTQPSQVQESAKPSATAPPLDPVLSYRRAIFSELSSPSWKHPAESRPTEPASDTPRVDPAAQQNRSSPTRPSDAEQPSTGDPKPAFARPSGVMRSRPARPSGAFAVARASGAFPIASPSAETHTTEPAIDSAPPQPQKLDPVNDSNAGLPAPDADTFLNESPETKSGKRQIPGRGKTLAAMMFASVALLAYAFEISSLQDAADAAMRQAPFESGALTSLLPWLLVIPAVVLFGLIVWLLAGLIGLRHARKRSKATKAAKRPRTPLEHFKQAALRNDIENRTAYRGWRLLETACGGDRPFTINSSLTDDLALTSREIRAVHLQLLTDLSRVANPAMKLPPAETVLDLLRAVETAPIARPSTNSGEVPIPGDPGQRRQRNITTS